MKTCLFLLCFAFGFWFGRTCKRLKKSKFIILSVFLIIIVSRETFASEQYKIEGDYRIYDLQDNPYQVDMPPLNFFPNIIGYSNTNYLNLTMGNTTYQLNQTIKCNDFNDVYFGATLISGTKYGNLGSYTQTFSYLNTDSDYYSFYFALQQIKGGQGWVDLYANIDGSWVKAETYSNVGTSFTIDTVLPENKINGWRCVCHWELTNRFTLLRPDDTYADGYKFNQFSMIVKDSQQQADDVQDKIEENTRQTNGLLGTIKIGIDNVITGITGIPQAIADKLEELFVPTDIYYTLESGAEDIIDSLGVLGYPLDFYVKTMQICRDVDTQSMPVEIPAIYYNGHTIFPRYYRSDIFYFRDMPVFTNVQKTTWMRQLLGTVGIDMDTVTIGQFVKKIMNIVLFFGLVRFFAFIFDCIFGTDVEEAVEDDN